MRTSNFLSFYGLLLGMALFSIWFSQQSINAYWQLTYHQASPLEALERFSWWKSGGSLQQSIHNYLFPQEESSEHFSADAPEIVLETPAEVLAHKTSEVIDKTEDLPKKTAEPVMREIVVIRPDGKLEALQITEEEFQARFANAPIAPVQEEPVLQEIFSELKPIEPLTEPANTAYVGNAESAFSANGKILLYQGDKVFFAGDSLMQGVAPIVAQKLKKQGIDSINLSKQSTGLSYPKFFDWPHTIEQTLKNNRDIKVLAMFLGANDPWDFPNPKGGGRYLKFKSAAWEEVYLARVERIVQACERAGVAIVWLGIPYMKKDKFNQQMRYLDGILKNHLQNKVLWLPTEALLSGNHAGYRDSITINGKTQTVRAKDGIHFSGQGMRLLADYVLQHLDIQ